MRPALHQRAYCLLSILCSAIAASSTESIPQSPFILDRVVTVHLELSALVWQDMIANPRAKEYHSGTIVFDGTRLDSVAIRVKGNSSLNAVAGTASHRFSFKVDTNRYIAGQELFGQKKLNFNNGFKDPTLMREHLSYQLFRHMDVPASRTSFVDLWVANEHLGLYTLVEQVDDYFLADHFSPSNGDLYKPEFPDSPLHFRGTDFWAYQGIVLKQNQDTSDHTAFLHFVDMLNNGTESDLEAVFDVERFLKYVAINTVTANLDSYIGSGHNFYIYAEQGRFTVIPWDLNEAFGNFSCGCNRAGIIALSIDAPTCGPIYERPLLKRILTHNHWRQRYHQYIEQLIEGAFSTEIMNARIDSIAKLIRPFVEADATKFYTTKIFEASLIRDIGGSASQIAIIPGGRNTTIGLKAFVHERIQALEDQLAGHVSTLANDAGSCASPGRQPAMNRGRPPCGDRICDRAEMHNPLLCPRDCTNKPDTFDWCGDGICDALEHWEDSCSKDCP